MTGEPTDFFYLLSAPRGEEELAGAEFQAMVGNVPNESRLPSASLAADVTNAAYICFCAESIASSRDLAELCQRVRQRRLTVDGFAIRERRIPRGLRVNLREAVISVANCIIGRPDLRDPVVEFILVASPAGWHFGRTISQADRSWAAHGRKLHSCSSSISSRMARAMVNLVARQPRTLLDPCCGAGTILIEAASLGLEAVGCDTNPLWAARTQENAARFGLPVRTFVADAREVAGRFDAVVTDLPYGRNAPLEASQIRSILGHLSELAPALVLVTGQPVQDTLARLGYRILLRATARKGGLVRHFYSCLAGRGCSVATARPRVKTSCV